VLRPHILHKMPTERLLHKPSLAGNADLAEHQDEVPERLRVRGLRGLDDHHRRPIRVPSGPVRGRLRGGLSCGVLCGALLAACEATRLVGRRGPIKACSLACGKGCIMLDAQGPGPVWRSRDCSGASHPGPTGTAHAQPDPIPYPNADFKPYPNLMRTTNSDGNPGPNPTLALTLTAPQGLGGVRSRASRGLWGSSTAPAEAAGDSTAGASPVSSAYQAMSACNGTSLRLVSMLQPSTCLPPAWRCFSAGLVGSGALRVPGAIKHEHGASRLSESQQHDIATGCQPQSEAQPHLTVRGGRVQARHLAQHGVQERADLPARPQLRRRQQRGVASLNQACCRLRSLQCVEPTYLCTLVAGLGDIRAAAQQANRQTLDPTAFAARTASKSDVGFAESS